MCTCRRAQTTVLCSYTSNRWSGDGLHVLAGSTCDCICLVVYCVPSTARSTEKKCSQSDSGGRREGGAATADRGLRCRSSNGTLSVLRVPANFCKLAHCACKSTAAPRRTALPSHSCRSLFLGLWLFSSLLFPSFPFY